MAKNSVNAAKIGKGKPPKDAQWQKGQSGNPKGKEPGTKNRATRLKYWLEVQTKEENPLTSKAEELSQEDAIILAAIKEAKGGNINAFNAIMDSVYGKLKETVQIATPNVIVPGE